MFAAISMPARLSFVKRRGTQEPILEFRIRSAALRKRAVRFGCPLQYLKVRIL